MKFSHFFIDRPIFAWVISIITVIVGGLAYFNLPVALYPEVAPPTVSATSIRARLDSRIMRLAIRRDRGCRPARSRIPGRRVGCCPPSLGRGRKPPKATEPAWSCSGAGPLPNRSARSHCPLSRVLSGAWPDFGPPCASFLAVRDGVPRSVGPPKAIRRPAAQRPEKPSRRDGRAVEGARLESVCRATYRGFESHSLRH